MALAFEEDGQSKAIAAEWGIDPDLLDEAEWELESIDSNDGFTVSYIVRFSEDTDRELLNQLGVRPGELHRELSMNAFDQPDDEEEYERYRVRASERGSGISTGAAFVGNAFAGDAFAAADSASPWRDSGEADDGIYSINEPLPDVSTLIDDDLEVAEPAERPGSGRGAYFIDDERFTPSQFRKLSRRRKVEAMVQWFHENYEDPAVRVPYESREGGYQWIWGGPYDAREQIGDQFSDLADEGAIEAAVAEVTRDGLLDWAPKAGREHDVLSDEPPAESQGSPVVKGGSSTFGNSTFANFGFARPDSAANALVTEDGSFIVDKNGNRIVTGEGNHVEGLRREMVARLDDLEALLRQNLGVAPNRGHNQPPELLEIERPVTQEQFRQIASAIDEVRRESESPAPNPENIASQVSVFRRIARLLGMGTLWLGGAAATGIISQEAGIVFTAHKQQIFDALTSAADSVSAWLQLITPIF